jgi:pyridoxamine 5'-phosphate oxidase
MKKSAFSSIRREYGARTLLEGNVASDPITQFKTWFDEIIDDELEPTAMTLATVDALGMPDVRVVLLKGIEDGNFIFYTHYDSAKGQELARNPKAALNFFWRTSVRQVKIRGTVQKVPEQFSDEYFSSRPRPSQLSAIASHQSHILENRAILEDKVLALSKQYEHTQHLPRPKEWGGYAVFPLEIEFWQGRDNRLHDRIRYRREKMQWIIERLSP